MVGPSRGASPCKNAFIWLAAHNQHRPSRRRLASRVGLFGVAVSSWFGSARSVSYPFVGPLVSFRSAKISEEHREKFRFDKFIVVAPCDDAGGAAGSGPAMLSDFYISKFDDEVLLQVRAARCPGGVPDRFCFSFSRRPSYCSCSLDTLL